jgi:ATP-binding cassette, subfamily C, bacterial LapB
MNSAAVSPIDGASTAWPSGPATAPDASSSTRKPAPAEGISIIGLLGHALRVPPTVILSSIVINLLGLVLPLAILQIFDRVLRNQSVNTLALLVIGLLCVIIAETALRFARNHLLHRTALREGFELHMRAVTGFLGAPRSANPKQSAESAFDAMSAVDDVSTFLSGNGRLALLDLPFVVLFLAVIWAIGGPIAIIPIALIVIFLGWTIWSSEAFKRSFKEQARREPERFGFYSECLKGIATIKSLAVEPQMERRLERILQSGADVNYRLVLQANRMISWGQLFASLTMVSIVTVGAILAIDGTMTIGAVAACTLIGNRVTQPVLRIIGVWGQMESARLARERSAQLLSAPARETKAPPPAGPGAIRLSHVAMSTAAGDETSGIDLDIAPGAVVGIVGSNFTQRAQLLDMLRGRVRPDRGAVMIDGVDLAAPGGEAQLQGVYYLGANPVIFRGTILENIAMFRGGVSQIKAVATARSLGVDAAIQALPDGYETRIGDLEAAPLPLDLMRAIGIVRAVASRPRILLLDQGRLSPDDNSAKANMRTIGALRGSVTILIFAEQLSEVEDAGRILVLRDWRLEEIDPALRLADARAQQRVLTKEIAKAAGETGPL